MTPKIKPTVLIGDLTFTLEPSHSARRAFLNITLRTSNKVVTLVRLLDVVADPDSGVCFYYGQPGQRTREFFSGIKLPKINGDFEARISDDGMLFTAIRPKDGKWVPVAADMGSGLYQIVQAANGLGFVRTSNQPEYYPPTSSLRLKFKVNQWLYPRRVITDTRNVVNKIQTPVTRFKLSPVSDDVGVQKSQPKTRKG